MAEKANEVASRMQQLAADANSQQMRVLQQYADLYQKFITGNAAAVDPAKTAQFFIEEGTAYLQGLAELNLRMYSELFELSRGINDRYVKLLDAQAGGAKKSPSAARTQSVASAVSPAKRGSKKKR